MLPLALSAPLSIVPEAFTFSRSSVSVLAPVPQIVPSLSIASRATLPSSFARASYVKLSPRYSPSRNIYRALASSGSSVRRVRAFVTWGSSIAIVPASCCSFTERRKGEASKTPVNVHPATTALPLTSALSCMDSGLVSMGT